MHIKCFTYERDFVLINFIWLNIMGKYIAPTFIHSSKNVVGESNVINGQNNRIIITQSDSTTASETMKERGKHKDRVN